MLTNQTLLENLLSKVTVHLVKIVINSHNETKVFQFQI